MNQGPAVLAARLRGRHPVRTANEIAVVDRLHLRFVGTDPGAPRARDDVASDTRADDEPSRAVEPAFLRGLVLSSWRYPAGEIAS